MGYKSGKTLTRILRQLPSQLGGGFTTGLQAGMSAAKANADIQQRAQQMENTKEFREKSLADSKESRRESARRFDSDQDRLKNNEEFRRTDRRRREDKLEKETRRSERLKEYRARRSSLREMQKQETNPLFQATMRKNPEMRKAWDEKKSMMEADIGAFRDELGLNPVSGMSTSSFEDMMNQPLPESDPEHLTRPDPLPQPASQDDGKGSALTSMAMQNLKNRVASERSREPDFSAAGDSIRKRFAEFMAGPNPSGGNMMATESAAEKLKRQSSDPSLIQGVPTVDEHLSKLAAQAEASGPDPLRDFSNKALADALASSGKDVGPTGLPVLRPGQMIQPGAQESQIVPMSRAGVGGTGSPATDFLLKSLPQSTPQQGMDVSSLAGALGRSVEGASAQRKFEKGDTTRREIMSRRAGDVQIESIPALNAHIQHLQEQANNALMSGDLQLAIGLLQDLNKKQKELAFASGQAGR